MKPTEVIIFLNSGCNARCSHCYLPYKGCRNPKESLDLVKKLKDDGYKVGCAGSEVLLDLDYLESYRAAGQKYVLTNGILISKDPKILDRIIYAGIEQVDISLHFNIHNELSAAPLDAVCEAIRQAKLYGLKVGLDTIISKANYADAESMCEKAHNLGVDAIKFFRFVKSGKGRNSSQEPLNEEEILHFGELIETAKKNFNKNDLEIKMFGNFGPLTQKGKDLSAENRYCPAGVSSFSVSPDNIVYGCPFLMEFPIGRLTDEGIVIERELCEGKRDRCLTDCLL